MYVVFSGTLMSTARSYEPVSVEDYLAGELVSDIRHEFADGYVYAMVGGTNAHNLIAGNCFATLHNQLEGKPCQVFNSDTRIRVLRNKAVRFYYPDAGVTCQPNPQSDLFQDNPAVIIEVLSESTRRKDELEKREVFCALPSMQQYILLEQHSIAAIVYARDDESNWSRFVCTDPDDEIFLPAIQAKLPLRTVYRGIEF